MEKLTISDKTKNRRGCLRFVKIVHLSADRQARRDSLLTVYQVRNPEPSRLEVGMLYSSR